MDRNKTLACAYIADMNVETVTDGGDLSDQRSPSPSPPDEGAPLSIATLAGVILAADSSITELTPVCLSSLSQIFNSVLDSGCTNHIVKDRLLFWTYHTALTVPVKTANCGVLETLVKGNIKFRVQCGLQSVVFVL